jgi:hypothetical protein
MKTGREIHLIKKSKSFSKFKQLKIIIKILSFINTEFNQFKSKFTLF